MGRMVPKAFRRHESESDDDHQRDAGQQHAEVQQIPEHEHGREQPACEFDQAGAQQIANAVHVGHDARYQRSGLVRVVVGDRQPANVRLYFRAQFGDQALPGFGHQLRDGEPRDALNDGRRQHRQHQGREQLTVDACR